ncbi:putative streptomycin phosphotransferase [Mycolicibacterium litorale]|uniref:Putative streptomycin phosphotransferase n=1 Tax=Mycolicibacterium litorale TaxID=758802 RepID=A0A6S6NWG3_9MYCO|nr:APH(3'') family aminoglycoside O-phosphotransferase [Mycolicibacterium litorale]BCI51473.1 putative streptomycin phosphotransferase [Mycolicibacterium litorale]
MADWSPVTTGESGARVFCSADGTRYRKVVDGADAAALADERDRIEWAGAHGIPGPSVLDWRRTRDGAELIMTAVAGTPADRLSARALAAAWPHIVAAVRALHDVPAALCPYRRDLDAMLARARDVVSRDAVNPDFLPDEDRGVPPTWLLERVERDAGRRGAQERAEAVVCHGDLCLPNIVVDGAQVAGFVDLGRLGLADPHADLSLLLESTRQAFPAFAAAARTVADRDYPRRIDDERLQFYLWLDPLTW